MVTTGELTSQSTTGSSCALGTPRSAIRSGHAKGGRVIGARSYGACVVRHAKRAAAMPNSNRRGGFEAHGCR